MFNKSALLILVTAAFAVALPTDPIPNFTSNVKPPSLARRAESCSSNYTLIYCRKVLEADNSFIQTLLQSMGVDTSVTGPLGLSCSAAKTTDYINPLCSQTIEKGLAMNCVEALVTRGERTRRKS
ncbi:uncharacterized protein EDB91DRAFT_709048 [Suillus paluster]|uniref:uncharacterized protein n=1 Tax=Suillus paluster TaxID=48578 RepID=UPI001B87493D|nr:uncharacterized protein EDB91DRAFT_709048 [Suillus paluster]KAG1731839.1 hypothetical protein EDB91DRAFT_709048 [Suillus paluster]